MDAKFKRLLDAKEKQEQARPAVVAFVRFVEQQDVRAQQVVEDARSIAQATTLGPHLITYSYK